MLKELVHRWVNHSVMIQWMSRFFSYLDRFFIARRSLVTLQDVGLIRFRELVSPTISLHLSVQKCCIQITASKLSQFLNCRFTVKCMRK